MSSTYPTTIDTFTNPTGAHTLATTPHSTIESNQYDAIEALEAKVGADSSAVTTSHDYKLSGVATGDKAASKTGVETLTNKTLTSPIVSSPPVNIVRVTGEIILWSTALAPSGWLLCDGAAVSRSTYADLFAVISTTYGVGNGTTTFNVPNLKGRVPVGLNSSETEFDALGETGGAKTHTLTVLEMPAHDHDIKVGDTSPGDGSGARFSNTTNTSNAYINDTGGGTAHNNLQPYLVLNYIVKI